MIEKFMPFLNESVKDTSKAESAEMLEEFVCTYWNARVTKVSVGTSVIRYYVLVNAKQIDYFLKLTKQFNAHFDTNNVRLSQDGKYVLIEVPNKEKGTYGMRDCAEALGKIEKKENELNISIGEDVSTECITYNLVDMPHMIVAGQTGSGKSVFLHNVILSLIMQYTPKELELVLIDPKVVEFNFYKGEPHVRELVSSPNKAGNAIEDLCVEMDNRYKKFAEEGVQDIATYNKKTGRNMSRIVLIIEELADLALSSRDDVIVNILKLTFKARACGIHVILCTQRPDSQQLSGKLKNNFQCRVAFSMASQHDSKTVLGKKGAEVLTGKGDGIFRNNNGTSNIRFQSPLVTEKEITAVVEQCKKMYKK